MCCCEKAARAEAVEPLVGRSMAFGFGLADPRAIMHALGIEDVMMQ